MSLSAVLTPPYYAVIFTSSLNPEHEGYQAMGSRMEELARQQVGFLGVDGARGGDGLGITVSYWASEDAISNWKANVEHQVCPIGLMFQP